MSWIDNNYLSAVTVWMEDVPQIDIGSFMTCHWLCNESNMTGDTSGAGSAYPSGAHDFIPRF